MYEDLNLVLIVQCAECFAQQPFFVLSLSAVEVFSSAGQHALVHCSLSLSSDANVVLIANAQFVENVIAIYALLTCCLCAVHVCIILLNVGTVKSL